MTDATRDPLRAAWEERAANEGMNLSGVLLKNLPAELNLYLHNRHLDIVLNKLLPLIPPGAMLLDVGCGYGRIGRCVRETRPDIRVVGMDFSFPYCRQYHDHVSEAVACADVAKIPFRRSSIDGILAATSLMYVPPSDRTKVMRDILDLLAPGGAALFIDPGRELMALVELLRRQRRRTTSGYEFSLNQYDALGMGNDDTDIVASGGFPGFSLLLPLLYLLRARPTLLKPALRLAVAFDLRFSRLRRFTIHRWMILKKRG
ncbi:MAG: class I SAM-dependent methyltransferase [Smithellaceae bacterium]|nr:class I SAM-dependent methyltransferase [Smithellaceae bacterium]